MNVKEVPQYDLVTGEYVGKCLVNENPRGSGYLLPENTTEVEVPEYGQYQKPVWDKNTSSWKIVPDYRGVKVYSIATDTLGKEIHLTLGEDLGTDKTLLEPPKPEKAYQKLNWDGSSWDFVNDANIALEIIRITRDRLISETDWLVLRHKDELDRGVITSLSNSEYQELLTYRQALRDFPDTVQDLFNPTYPQKPAFMI